MKFKGTKGEWVVDLQMVASNICEKGDVICVIPSEDCPESRKNWKANAKLIAAAPDLLEALLSIENDDNSIPETIWEMRNKAIEKALK